MSDNSKFNENDSPIATEADLVAEEGLTEESWQSDAPPEDGFHDSTMTSEDIVEETTEFEDSYEAPAQGKDRGKAIFYGALGVAALLVGGMLVMQFSGSSGEALPSSLVAAQAPATQVPAAPVDAPLAPTTGETDLSSLYQASNQPPAASGSAMPDLAKQQDEKPAVTTEVMTLADQVAAEAKTALPESVQTAPAPTVARIENVPVTAEPVVAVIPPPKPEKIESVTRPTETPAAVSSNVEARLAEMADKIKSLESSLEQAVRKNGELVSRLETMAGNTTNSTVEDRLAKLEQRTQEPAKAPVKIKTSVKKAVREEPASAQILTAETTDVSAGIVTDLLPEEQVKEALFQAEPKPEKKAVTAKKKVAPKKEVKARPAKTKTASKAAESSGLVLRAATPDAAWVSGDAQTQELQRVTVGESLPGLGKIKEIRQTGDQWEIVGTLGTLR